MREEENIENTDLQDDDQSELQDDVYDGLGDFVEYDDLANLEGLPQLDELDKMDDLSAISEVAASIKMDDLKHNDTVDEDIDIPLPDIGIPDYDEAASGLSDGEDFPKLEPEEKNIPDENEQSAEKEDDVSEISEPVEEIPLPEEPQTDPATDAMQMPVDEDVAPDDVVPLPEVEDEALDDAVPMPEVEDEAPDDVVPLPEVEDEVPDDTMSMPEPESEGEAPDDIMSIPEVEEETPDDIMSIPESEEEASDDLMSMLESEADDKDKDSESNNIDDMLGGLLDDLDTNGSITPDDGNNNETFDQEETAAGESSGQSDDIEDLLGMLSDDSGSEDIMSLDNTADDTIPDINDISPDESGVGDIADILPTEEEKAEAPKKPGFFKKVFGNVVTDEIAEAEKQAKEDEAAKQEEAEKLKEEKAAEKAKQKEEKEKEKAAKAEEKAAKKAKKAEEKAAKKAEKQAQKEAEKEAAANEVVGKLNKVGVAIVVVIGIIFLAGTVFLTNSFGSSLDKKEAKNYFDMSKYSKAYEAAVGTNMKKKDPEQYDRILTLMKVQHSLDAYQNYENVKRYPEALDALLMGLRKYDANKKKAYDLEIEDKLEDIYNKILDVLSEEFGVSKSQAYNILGLSGSDYTKKVTAIANK